METIKSGLGLAPKDTQEGTEPLSGETGKGTTAEPFDKGNAAGEPFQFSLFLGCGSKQCIVLPKLRNDLSERAVR